MRPFLPGPYSSLKLIFRIRPSVPTSHPDLSVEILKEMPGRGRWKGEIAFHRKDGAEGFCETILVPHADEWGRTVAAIQVNREITELKRLKEGAAPISRT